MISVHTEARRPSVSLSAPRPWCNFGEYSFRFFETPHPESPCLSKPADAKPSPDRYTALATAAAPAVNTQALVALMLCVSVVTLDISLTSTAIPAIAAGLGVSATDAIWAINIYYLTVVAALLPLGALGEIVGQRRIFMVGLGIFAAGALASGLSGSLSALVAARGLQGIGAAAISATTPALIKALYPPDKIGRGLGLYAMVVGVAFTAGPTAVSAVLSITDWPWLYLGMVPVTLLGLLLAYNAVPHTDRATRAFDPVAATLCALMFASLLTALASVGHLKLVPTLIGIIAASVLGYALARREADKPAPILAIDLFRIRLFALSSLTSITAFVVQALVFVVLPLLLTVNFGFTEVQAGLLITPWPAALVVTNALSGRLSEHINPGMLGAIGMSTVAVGLVFMATLTPTPEAWDIIWRLALCGVGFGLFQSPNMVALMNSAPKERSGSAGSILATSRLLGQSVGAASVAFCLTLFVNDGIQVALWVGVAAAALSATVSAIRLTSLAR